MTSGSYNLQAEAANYFTQTRPITVTDDRTEDFYLEPFCPPVLGVDFDYTPPDLVAWEPVTFTAVATGTAGLPITYTWDFGDESGTEEGVSVTHIFPFATTTQTFTVTLTATNGCLSQRATRQTVTVRPGIQVCPKLSGVGFDHAPPKPLVWETVAFTANAATGTLVRPITYTWDFGDGVTSTIHVNMITHTFPFVTTAQTYTVSLTIANDCPSEKSVEKTIIVLPPPYVVYLPLVLKDD